MEENSKTKSSATSNIPEEKEFKGYTLDELKYQRALLLLKKEFLKEKAIKEANLVKERIPVLNGSSALSHFSSKNILGRVIKGLNYADYIMLGFSVFNAGKKVISLFSRIKK